ncbi:hypothetical protein ACGFYZ_30630 [Streptomyces sp. NPDC048330]|uniref:hypothetical protein n=1 Tax=Streptomyces sp. NPDC048330 TaxID=3365533 RepID=UPI0037141244
MADGCPGDGRCVVSGVGVVVGWGLELGLGDPAPVGLGLGVLTRASRPHRT